MFFKDLLACVTSPPLICQKGRRKAIHNSNSNIKYIKQCNHMEVLPLCKNAVFIKERGLTAREMAHQGKALGVQAW